VKAKLLGVVPLGDCGAYAEFSRTLDLEINAFVQRLGVAVEAAARRGRVDALRDIVPAFGGLALHFDPEFDGDVLEAARALVEGCIKAGVPEARGAGRLVEVPVCYEPQFAPDLDEVAQATKIPREKVAALHCAPEYRVLMVGFAPGHGYLWGLDPKLSVPRRADPRAEVPAGSVAIANEQTVVYPYAISGGWSIIGRTPLKVFDAAREAPSLFLAGDRVRFHPIDAAEFRRLAGEK
jgi:KipI family sensor histidine kinase inhibitor